MSAYNELYLSDIMRRQGDCFMAIREKLPGVDEQWFITAYMKSHIRAMLDIGNPRHANLPGRELIVHFIDRECDGEYMRGAEWGGFLPEWAGKIFALYQWKYNVSSKNLIEVLPLSELERVFPTLHQASWDVAVDKIYAQVLGHYGEEAKGTSV